MKKLIVILVSILISLPAFAWQQREPLSLQQCSVHAPYGLPGVSRVTPICRQGYLVGYDSSAKIPKFVLYSLQPQNVLGCVIRSNAFAADQSVSDGATPNDYVGTGYDQGHQAPDGDMSWDQQVELESFLMTNMAPQAGSLNRGIWKLLETSVNGWSTQMNHSLEIYVGAVYDSTDKKIGKGVVVPHAFYKIVIDESTGQYAAWMFPHVAPYPNLGNDLTKYRVSVDQVQKISGIRFTFPANGVELPVGKEWSVDYGALTRAKRAKCN